MNHTDRQNSLTYRPDIDGLRAVAVLFVLLFHAFPQLAPSGFIGVDVFFVISGFLITGIILKSFENDTFSFADFYSRRVRRIFPALLLVLAFCLGFGWFALFADEFQQLGKHTAGGAGFILNFIFWKESGYFDTASEVKPLLHLWSLSLEEQFYIFWPLLLFFFSKRRWSPLNMILLLGAASFALSIYKTYHNIGTAFYSPQTRFWELLLGALLACLLPKPFEEKEAGYMSFTGLLLIVTGGFVITRENLFPGWWPLFPCVGTFLVIAAGKNAWLNRKVLSHPLLTGIGLISYPLYLWHWPVLSLGRIIENETPAVGVRIGLLFAAFVLAVATYFFIERPLRQIGARRAALALLFFMLVAGITGGWIYQNDGFNSREAAKRTHLNSFTTTYRESCSTLTGETYEDDWCNAGSSSYASPTVALIGDSIANSYSPMLKAYVTEHSTLSFIQFARGQCPALLDYGPEYCRKITADGFAYVKSHSEIKIVVMAGDWPVYFRGKNFKWVHHSETTEAFQTALERTIQTYKALGKKVVLLLTPPMGANPKACSLRPIRLTNNNKCNLKAATALFFDGNYRRWLLPKLQVENIPHFDPFLYFCDSNFCKTSEADKAYTVDGQHLSVFGGEFLARTGKNRLDELFQ